MDDEPTILFDGVCNLCNGWVKFVLKHEKAPVLKFAPLQSGWAKGAMGACGMDSLSLESVVLVEAGKCFTKSSAVFRMVRYLRWPWRLAAVLWVIPWFIRDWVYDWVARNRYGWFGKSESCLLMTGPLKARFRE